MTSYIGSDIVRLLSGGLTASKQGNAYEQFLFERIKMEETEEVRKPITFLGRSLDELKSFPPDVMQDAGYQLSEVQFGREPSDWKEMKTVGPGAKEIRIWDAGGTYRVVYVAKFEDMVFVLCAFKKTSEKTGDSDIQLARQRYKLINEKR